MISKLFLIAIGNEYRSDDGVGPFILRQIRDQHPTIPCLEHRGEGVDLLHQWQGYERVILFDAVSSGAKPGTQVRLTLPGGVIPKESFGCSTHTFSLAEVIELARTLDQLPKQLIVYGVEGKSFDRGLGLSPEVQQTAEAIARDVIKEIDALLEHNNT